MKYKVFRLAAVLFAGGVGSVTGAPYTAAPEFTDVDSVRFAIDGPTAYDTGLLEGNAANSVPEPAMVVPMLGLFAGVGYMVLRRRREVTTATA